MRETLFWRAKVSSASATLSPVSDTVSAPISSASFMASASICFSAGESGGWAGVST